MLHPLKFRLETSKRVSNLRLDLLKRIYDGYSIIEGYEEHKVKLHVHGVMAARSDSVINEQTLNADGLKNVCGVITAADLDAGFVGLDSKVSMLVRVRKGSQEPYPVSSFVRLQALDSCDMNIIDSLESGFGLSLELLFRVCNEKLSTALHNVGIEDSELIDQVVKARPEMEKNFANKNTDFRGDGAFRSCDLNLVARLEIDLCATLGGFVFAVNEGFSSGFQLRKVFHCPVEPDISIVKGMG